MLNFFFNKFYCIDFSFINLYQQSETISSVLTNTKDLPSLLLGTFFGLMVVMAIYNLLLYFFLKDKAYLLYVGTTIFSILASISINRLGDQFLWPISKIDSYIYITFSGFSIFFSSRFAAVFLQLKKYSKPLNMLMWVIAYASLLLSLTSISLDMKYVIPFGRWLVLLSFPSYLIAATIVYKKNYKPALFYLIAWIPYVLGLVTRTLHGAGWLPDHPLILSSLELGGSLEIMLLSFALAYRIKGMREELVEKELEKEQFKTKLLEDQKGILEQKVNERTTELKKANETKDKFFSIIAHDLRSPMIGLQGVGQKLAYFIKKNKQEKLLQIGSQIDTSIDQLNHLLNNLLNWAASQTDGIPYHPKKHKVTPLIEENINLYKSLAKTKEVTVNYRNIDADFYADINTVSTVIRNLLSNAIKFTKHSSSVTIKAEELDEFIAISFIDEGEGMSKEQVKSLLNENNFMSTSGTEGEKGFGLGLRLCKEFTEMNFGKINIESTLGVGTTFTIFIPRSKKS